MNWYIVDKKYINYLTQFDSHVGYVKCSYLFRQTQTSKMSNSLDFHKLQDESTRYLYAVLNINNMIPVPDNCLTQLKYNQIDCFRSFLSYLHISPANL